MILECCSFRFHIFHILVFPKEFDVLADHRSSSCEHLLEVGFISLLDGFKDNQIYCLELTVTEIKEDNHFRVYTNL